MDGEFVFDCSGYSVSLSGDVSVLAIGAICNDCNGAISEHVRLNCWDVGLVAEPDTTVDGRVTVPVKVGPAKLALAFNCVWIAEVTPSR